MTAAGGGATCDDVLALAQLVAPSGRAVGVDAGAMMLAEAVHRAATAGIVAEFVQMDAQRLELPDAQFDGVRAERLLQHVPVPDEALRELVRVAQPRATKWLASLANARDAGCFFCAIGGVLASGRKPS